MTSATGRDHAAETTEAVRHAIDTLTMARIDAYATGEEVGAEVDYAIEKLDYVLKRIKLGVTGTPTAITAPW